ncbi:MAG: AzlD domain-containing protein [Actinomycetales bacterium]|nr:AzlD domain-containing protein [Actinomycetales bacterium]
MSLWVAVLLACALAYLTKLAGHLVPPGKLEGRRVRRVTGLLPVALLTSLVVVQTFAATGGGLTLDARVVGLGAAIVALTLRAPFIVVVAVGAAVAAGLRAFGWS